jgi:hypothetical protein
MNTWDLIRQIEWQLTSCPTCGRDNYTAAPWMDINAVRLLVAETKRLLEESEQRRSHETP